MHEQQNYQTSTGLAGQSNPTPGTFAAILMRLEQLERKSAGVRNHTQELREKIIGIQPTKEGKQIAPRAVASGFIEQFTEILDSISNNIVTSDENLEHLWSKVG